MVARRVREQLLRVDGLEFRRDEVFDEDGRRADAARTEVQLTFGEIEDADVQRQRADRAAGIAAGAELSCQAMLRARIVFVVAPWVAKAGMFSEGTATWDGVEVDLGAGRNASGSIGALSLHCLLYTSDAADD